MKSQAMAVDTQELRTMKAVIFSVAVSGLLLWLVLLRAVADLFFVCVLRRKKWAKRTARCLMKCASGPAFYQ